MIGFPNAKINLGLNIISKRSDGFHNLESVFLPLRLSDVLEVIPCSEFDNEKEDFLQSGISIDVNPEKNLVIQAYNLLKSDFDLPPVKIALHKIIPSGAGLGGGSSDAAFMVSMLDKLFYLNLPSDKIKLYLDKLGSDCPFFLSNKVSFVSGRGENLQSFRLDLKGINLVLIVPEIKISTAESFRLITPGFSENSLKESLRLPMEKWRSVIINDFEKVLFPRYPELKRIKEKLYDIGAVYASLSGSGSAIYGLFNNEVDPQKYFPGLFTWMEKFE